MHTIFVSIRLFCVIVINIQQLQETPNGLCGTSWPMVVIITATSNDRHCVLNYRSVECLLNSLFRLTTQKYQWSALLSLCEGWPVDSPHENVSIWWHHNDHMSAQSCHITDKSTVFNTLFMTRKGRKYENLAMLILREGNFSAFGGFPSDAWGVSRP